jgi:hypothetical protein
MKTAPAKATTAPNMVPRAMSSEAAPPAGGAGAAPVAPAPALPVAVTAVPVSVGVVDEAPEVMVALTLPVEKDAEGPTALDGSVETVPLIVMRLEAMLTMDFDDDDADDEATDDDEGVGFWGNVAWMRISSHWAPIHSS